MSAELLAARGISVRFGRLNVLVDLDLTVYRGELLGIIGPNGAGKSTLLSVLGGTTSPQDGRIVLDGVDITSRRSSWRSRQGIATSYQIPRPFLGMTVYENALVAARFAGNLRGREAQQSAVEAISLANLEQFADVQAKDLRLLDRKRLEVARALASKPRLLLLDEIAGGLTESEVPELLALVRGVLDAGVTVVWIEHVVHALLSVATRMICLTYGSILAEGDPHDVMESPAVRQVYLGIEPDDDVLGLDGADQK
ncbi:ABC transporter ATP-binding protein [Subtercola frigoramans]|uniref:Branched-chain amino acid transport system ATP-binding protein n=1 Tax=Subtercola frigoramans TaxID=120298 RepID=A0ABS2LA81_9MICO|nr:ATP-binding cassette domain-containing protein [Subtercola frigoramans]MBM7473660.1 branched-chain amino acid transport system ATP-binding protein [Subtercola frigoramans]